MWKEKRQHACDTVKSEETQHIFSTRVHEEWSRTPNHTRGSGCQQGSATGTMKNITLRGTATERAGTFANAMSGLHALLLWWSPKDISHPRHCQCVAEDRNRSSISVLANASSRYIFGQLKNKYSELLKLNDFNEMSVPAARTQLLKLTNVASSLCLAS